MIIYKDTTNLWLKSQVGEYGIVLQHHSSKQVLFYLLLLT